MPATPDDLFRFFADIGVNPVTVEHPPFFTVEEGRELKATIPGGHSKNLFMTNKDGDLVLVSAHADSQLKLNQMHKLLGVRRLSFGSAELMGEVLGVVPGSVTAFALINENARNVRFVLDKALSDHDPLCFHPLVNTATTAISRADFDSFLEAVGHSATIVDFTALG